MDTNSRVWYWHLAVAALWPLVVALVVVQPPSGVWLGVGVAGLIAMAGSLVGYFEEAKHFDGGEWARRGLRFECAKRRDARRQSRRRWQQLNKCGGG